ncbi:MAG TPA: hypothetical protein VF397_06525 [Pyrinomonadaceae bacterium]
MNNLFNRKIFVAAVLLTTLALTVPSQTRSRASVSNSRNQQQPTFDETINWVVDKLKLRSDVIVGMDGMSNDFLSSRLLEVRREGRALCFTDKWVTQKREFELWSNCVKFDDVASVEFESHWAANPIRVTFLQINFRHPVTELKKNRETGEMRQVTTDKIGIALHNAATQKSRDAAMSIRLKAALLRLVTLSGGLKKEPF